MNEQLVSQTLEEMESCDFASFSAAGSDPEEMRRSVERTNELLRKLSDFTPGRIE